MMGDRGCAIFCNMHPWVLCRTLRSRDMGVPLGVPLGEGAPLTSGDRLQGAAVWWEVSSPGLLRQTWRGKMVKAQLE